VASVFLVKVLGFPNMIPVPGSTTCGGAARSHDGNHPEVHPGMRFSERTDDMTFHFYGYGWFRFPRDP